MKLSSIAAAVILSSVVASSAQASQVAAELHGYVRSGTLWNTADGMRRGYRMGLRANSEGYFRLGNEEDTKLELLPTIKWTADDGVWAKMRANLTHQTSHTSDWNNSAYDAHDIQVRETFIEMGGFEFNPSTVFWAGKRYSQMEISSHQYSYDYLQNNGTGGGFENMDLGIFKWDLGFYSYATGDQDPNNETNKQGFGDEFSINTWAHAIGGTGLDIQLKYVNLTGTVKADKDHKYVTEPAQEGKLISVLYNTPGFFWFGNGYGKICFQYAKGADAGTRVGQNGYGFLSARDQETTRLIVEGLWDITKNFSTSVFAMYQYDTHFYAGQQTGYAGENKWDFPWGQRKSVDKKAEFVAIGIRPYHQITNHFAMQYELGYEHISNHGSDWTDEQKGAKDLFKATIAPTLTLDMGYWGRPQIRAFVTYGKWNKGAYYGTEFGNAKYINNGIDTANFGEAANKTEAWMVGFQGEAWF